ncbi:hypothetical protein [Pyxidicoccus xibeiensis]|uniref:hypothetical protein n=1 Tax=Pyxidicoccus xibeiensis TaxID=2906759 RepID=UPI0020A82891|nr:hypothetical protein [Pyxidicoccus xibeiensis]MCP3138802.1 hypothetical protein [Pyxidicoccus xibeiensis]
MDYRKFLGKVESAVLPYFGGGTVDAPSRRLRVAAPVRPGWWRFEVSGRVATAREPAGPEGLDGLPRVRGHVWGSRLVREGAVAEPLELMPEEEPPRLAPVCARRWHDGSLVFDGVEFEGEAEDAARRALEEGQSLSGAKGVSAPLRAAFGYALLEAASRALRIPFAPAELRGRVLAVAEGGRAEAEACLRHLVAEREAHLRERAVRAAALDARAHEEREAAQAREYSAGLVSEAQRRVAELGASGRWADERGAVPGRESESWRRAQGQGAHAGQAPDAWRRAEGRGAVPGREAEAWRRAVEHGAAEGREVEARRRAERHGAVPGREAEAWRRAVEHGTADRVRTANLVAEAQRRAGRNGRRAAREDGMDRAERALLGAGARLRDMRRLGGNRLEVTYSFMDERFISIVDADTLQVVDAGVCLAGADGEVTLESLPSVIREAIDTGVLVITRHA